MGVILIACGEGGANKLFGTIERRAAKLFPFVHSTIGISRPRLERLVYRAELRCSACGTIYTAASSVPRQKFGIDSIKHPRPAISFLSARSRRFPRRTLLVECEKMFLYLKNEKERDHARRIIAMHMVERAKLRALCRSRRCIGNTGYFCGGCAGIEKNR